MAYYCNIVLIALNNLHSKTKQERQVIVQFPVLWELDGLAAFPSAVYSLSNRLEKRISTSQEILLFHIGFYMEPEKQMSLEIYQ